MITMMIDEEKGDQRIGFYCLIARKISPRLREKRFPCGVGVVRGPGHSPFRSLFP